MESLQQKCITQMLATNLGNNSTLLIRMLERMINFDNLADDVLIRLYNRFRFSNNTIVNKLSERIEQTIAALERFERNLDNITLSGAAELDSSFDSEYDPEEYYERLDEQEMEREQLEQDNYDNNDPESDTSDEEDMDCYESIRDLYLLDAK